MKSLIYFICLVFAVSFGFSQSNNSRKLIVEKGVSKDLAAFRKNQVKDVSYNLFFSIPPEKTEPILSNLDLNLTLTDLSEPLHLDFNEKEENIKSIQANGIQLPIVHKNEHISIAPENLKIGINTITISFIAGDSSLNRNDEFLYTLLVPDRASTLFPCIDQPDIKATYKLAIIAPKDWKVISASPINKQTSENNTVKYEFAPSDKMSTYLFSFVAGKFNSATQNLKTFQSTFLYRENNLEKISESLDVIFNQHEQAITFLENYTRCPFPFQKLDFAAIPSHQYGGMEHVGAIQYQESDLFLDSSATTSEKLDRAKLIAHETAHVWFGNWITMKWFDDVWMKEVFANFMADKMVNPLFPEINHDLEFLISHYPSAYSEDRTSGTNPILQNLENLKNAGSLYGNIIYDKAPIMMRQLESSMGEKPFQKGIQKYIEKYANNNADWNDLVTILDHQTAQDLRKWSAVWVTQSGRPIISDNIEYDELNRIKSFIINQKAEDGSENFWPQIFDIGLVYTNEIKVIKVSLTDKSVRLKNLIGMPKPVAIIYNYNGFGYGVFPLEKNSLASFPSIKNEVARVSSYINLYENVLNDNNSPILAIKTCIEGIRLEQNELIVNLLSGQINSLFWKYLTPKQQQENREKITEVLYARLQENLPQNIKKTLFGLFSSLAYIDIDRERLYQIWSKEIQIDNLKLNEDDYTSIATDLIIFKHSKANEINAKTMESISNPDRKKRFQYLQASLSDDENERNAYMESLKDEKNRENESWVLSAFRNIFHPLRQESAEKYLKSTLNLIEEIQRTGDIFFPKAWISGSIGRYSSENAFQMVETFLKENPNFSPILKKKLMQATDGLYRAQKIKKETE